MCPVDLYRSNMDLIYFSSTMSVASFSKRCNISVLISSLMDLDLSNASSLEIGFIPFLPSEYLYFCS